MTDIDGTIGGTSLSLGSMGKSFLSTGAQPSYDAITTVNGNVKLNALPLTGTAFTLNNNLNALVIDNTGLGQAINLQFNNTTARNIASGTIINVGAGNLIGFIDNTLQIPNPVGQLNLGTSAGGEPNFFIRGNNMQQTLGITAGTTGTFSLGFPYYGNTVAATLGAGGPSANLGYLRTIPLPASGLTATVLQAALEALPNIGIGNVQVTSSCANSFTITFLAALAGGKLPKLTVNNFTSATNGVNVNIVPTTGDGSGGLTIASNLTGINIARKDRRGKLTLAGDDNGLIGKFTIMNGVVTAANDQVLGAAGQDKIVSAGSGARSSGQS